MYTNKSNKINYKHLQAVQIVINEQWCFSSSTNGRLGILEDLRSMSDLCVYSSYCDMYNHVFSIVNGYFIKRWLVMPTEKVAKDCWIKKVNQTTTNLEVISESALIYDSDFLRYTLPLQEVSNLDAETYCIHIYAKEHWKIKFKKKKEKYV